MKTALIAAACGLAAVATTGSAQVPADIAAKVRAAGQAMDPTISQLYAPMFPKEAWAGVSIERDIAYGADPLQKLDVYTPDGAQGAKRPVLLFVHGGGFTRGDKHGGFYPDNITLWAVRSGMVGVNIDYRLAPKDPWPAGVKDLASAIAWTRANIARYGGDPDRIVLFGHSAGANHVADYAAHPQVRGPEASSVRGVIMLSPAYSTSPGARPNAYYGEDADLGSASGQITRLTASPYALFYGYAEFDPPPMKATAAAVIEGVCRTRSRCPASVELKDSNHFSEGMAIGTPDQQLTAPLLEWIKALPGPSRAKP
ncbi:MAG TPA: alpha/beta hydrolase [Steroidobacteraceae bacterium]|nr:alpha/beta hydrolase [Steroidobacteraceae bacterium]